MPFLAKRTSILLAVVILAAGCTSRAATLLQEAENPFDIFVVVLFVIIRLRLDSQRFGGFGVA